MSQKREREAPQQFDYGSNEIPAHDVASDVVLQTKEGIFFVVKTQIAKRSETLKSLVEDAITAKTAIPLPNIRAHVLKYLVHYMKHSDIAVFVRARYSLLIEIVLATSYLDIDNGALLSELTAPFRETPTFRYGPEDKRSSLLLKRLMCNIECYPEKDAGFTEEERALFRTRGAHLSEIHTVLMRPPTGEFCLLDLPKDLFARYIFPPMPQTVTSSSWYIDYTEWIRTLLEFRQKHVYFWHTTTKYIISMAQKVLSDMVSFNEDIQFEFMCRLSYRSALKYCNITSADVAKHYGRKTDGEQTNAVLLYTAIKKHGSFQVMDDAVVRQEQLKLEREARIAREKRFEITNSTNAKNYFQQQGFFVDQIPKISDHLVVHFEQEPAIKIELERLENIVISLLKSGVSTEIARAATLTTPAKFRELLNFIPLKDDKTQALVDLCLKNGYVLSHAEIKKLPEFSIQAVESAFTLERYGMDLARYTTSQKFLELIFDFLNRKSEVHAKMIRLKTRLEENGYLFSFSELLALKSKEDVLNLVSNLHNKPLNFIIEHTTHARFLKLMEKRPL